MIAFRSFAVATLTSLCLLGLAGCGGGKRELTVSTGQPGGTYHPIATSIKEVFASELPNLELTLKPSQGSLESMDRLMPDHEEACELALLQNDTKGNETVRTVLPVFDDVLHFIVPMESTINGLAHLEAKRVAVGPPDSGTSKFVRHLFLHYGLSMSAIQPRQLTIEDACASMKQGELDAMLILAGFKPSAVKALLASHGTDYRFVSFGEPGGALDGFLLNYPFAKSYQIPEQTYGVEGQIGGGLPRAPILTVAVPTVLACRDDLPEDLVFNLTKAIVENRSKLLHEHPTIQITDHWNESALAFPLHPGSHRYMHRREPGFLVTYAEVMAFGLALMVATIGFLSAFRRWMALRKKNRIDTYYVRLNDLLEELQKTPSRDQLLVMEKDVSEMRHHAFKELVDERLVADESFRIFQSLLSDCQTQIYARLGQAEER